jgi:hypothetical protein
MTKDNETIKFFSTVSPEDLTNRLLEIGVSEKHIKNHLPKYFYIIDKIYSNEVINKTEKVCRLYSRLLDKLLGCDYYPKILKNLKDIGLVQLVSKFSIGNFSNGYILTENRGAKLYTFKNSRFVKKIVEDRTKRVEKDTQILSRLFRSLSNLQYDHIDRDNLSEDESKFLDMLENNLFQTVGEKGKRVYNNFSNLPKSIRNQVRLNNENLAFVDIVNSQMIFLSIVVKDYLKNRNISIDPSTDKFEDLATSGKLYEFILNHTDITDRKELKEKMFELIFSKGNYDTYLTEVFSSKFPQVLRVINQIKSDDYKVLSHLMQNKEAQVVYNALNSIQYQKEVLTVHDSLYAGRSEIKTITEALVKSFAKEGINATLNVNDEYTVTVDEYDLIGEIENQEIDKIIKDIMVDQDVFERKYNDLKSLKYEGKRIGITDISELVKTIDFDLHSEELIKNRVYNLTGSYATVNTRLKKINLLDYSIFWNGIFVNHINRNHPDENKKLDFIASELERMGVNII